MTSPTTSTPVGNSSETPVRRSLRTILPLTRLNFILMAVAGLVIVTGFLLMTGDPSGADRFNPDIFSTRRIVVGPTITFLGYIFMGVAIMWPSRRKPSTTQQPS